MFVITRENESAFNELRRELNTMVSDLSADMRVEEQAESTTTIPDAHQQWASVMELQSEVERQGLLFPSRPPPPPLPTSPVAESPSTSSTFVVSLS
jgi:hypothetical protein